jgi:hypothetical protein
MKKTFLLLATVFTLNVAQAEPTYTIQQDTVKVEQSDRKCNKAKRRATKRTGKRRTAIGKVLFDVVDVLKVFIPFLKLISK